MKRLLFGIFALSTLFSCTPDAVRSSWRYATLAPDSVPGPYRRVLAAETVHAALICELGAGRSLVGVCDADYVADSALHALLAAGRIADFGSCLSPDCERLAAASPDALLLSAVEGADRTAFNRLGKPVVALSDYLEPHPLGRAEWGRVIGRLVGRGDQADSLFAQVEARYDSLCREAAKRSGHPLLLCDMPQGGTWYVPGAESYLARLYRDAGYTLPFPDAAGAGSVPLPVEQVVAAAAEADVWLIKYAAPVDMTYDALLGQCPAASRIKAFRERHVLGCNTFRRPYYEQTPFHPDRLLQDLLQGTHVYFRPLK